MARAGAVTFSDLFGGLKWVRVACSKCDRAGRYRLDRLIELYGPRRRRPPSARLTADCPQRGDFRDPCGALFAD